MGESAENNRIASACICYLLALAYHAEGNAEEASQCLSKAVAWTDDVMAKHESGMKESRWNHRLILQLFRKESEALITDVSGDEKEPTNGNAPIGEQPTAEKT